MKRLFVLFLTGFFSVILSAQELTELNLSEFSKYSLPIFDNQSSAFKVIFSEPQNAYYPPNIKINIGEVAVLESFSEETYKIDEYNDSIPYSKILLNGEYIWIKGADAFIFNIDNSDTTFKLNKVEYKVFYAINLKFITNQEDDLFNYIGYRLIVVYNTLSHQYFLLKSSGFPEKLQGHSYVSSFVYLQEDFGVNEQITEIITEKNFVEFIISANYQEGNAKYSMIFYPYNSNIPVKYSSIKVEQ